VECGIPVFVKVGWGKLLAISNQSMTSIERICLQHEAILVDIGRLWLLHLDTMAPSPGVFFSRTWTVMIRVERLDSRAEGPCQTVNATIAIFRSVQENLGRRTSIHEG
jgi:hypothetical protein